MEQERRLRVPGTIEHVRDAVDFVVQAARDWGLNDDAIFHCELSVEEVFTNIVEHGYQHDGSDKGIELVCELAPNAILISIYDEAPQFNPLERDDPNPETELWERDHGGWGIYFVKQFMSDIRYQFEDNRNRIILEKRVG